MDFMSVIDAQFTKASKEGAFDNLPQEGKPLSDLDRSAMDVWLEHKMAQEGLSLPLPAGLQLRKDVEVELEALKGVNDEAEVRVRLAALNERIAHINAHHISGPNSGVAVLSVDTWVARWRETP